MELNGESVILKKKTWWLVKTKLIMTSLPTRDICSFQLLNFFSTCYSMT